LNKVEMRRFSEVRLVETGGEIGEVAKAVYDLAGELEKNQRTQKQFFQNASHELKTPLMSIQGYAEGIKDGIFTAERANKGLNVIVKECERLKKIVTEMILLAKLESEEGIFHMERFPLISIDSEGIRISISDDGDGIPESLLSQLFGRFVKGNNGETGLGLAISRAIVERCRGRISAHNEPGGGAAFVLRFPALG